MYITNRQLSTMAAVFLKDVAEESRIYKVALFPTYKVRMSKINSNLWECSIMVMNKTYRHIYSPCLTDRKNIVSFKKIN